MGSVTRFGACWIKNDVCFENLFHAVFQIVVLSVWSHWLDFGLVGEGGGFKRRTRVCETVTISHSNFSPYARLFV